MKKIVISMISNTLMILLPLLPKPELMIHPKILIIISAGIIIWLTQPTFSLKETQEQKNSDKSSVILILVMSFISIAFPIIIWAYFGQKQSSYGLGFVAGLCMIVIGLAYRAWAVQKLGKYFTPTVQIQSEHRLITSGPYKLVRHPSYMGAFLVITGCALSLETLIGYLISCIAMAFAYKTRIAIEEKELETHFGEMYRDYKNQSKRLIPFLW